MPRTMFEGVQRQLLQLIPRFGLSDRRRLVLDAFGSICGESLLLPVGSQRPETCRLNRDGTAIQFSLALCRGRAATLQFLGEAGAPGLDVEGRATAGLATMNVLADAANAKAEMNEALGLLQRMAPRHCDTANGSESGVYWLGVSFPPAGPPALTIYVNARFGTESEQWSRGEVFASHFEGADSWNRIKAELCGRMTPLGMAVTVSAGQPATGRIYFGAYGLAFCYCHDALVKITGDEPLGELFNYYIDKMIGGERAYPARSTVCSFEFEDGGRLNTKFELCAHCAYTNDTETAARCESWLRSEGLDAGLYLDMVRILGGGCGLRAPELHAYVGIGMRRGDPYSTFYLNPGPGLPA
jgi:hypothetical protein